MTSENVEIARRAYAAANQSPRPDFATVNALYHPDHELVSLFRFRQEASLCDASGFREWLAEADEAHGSRESTVDQAKAVGAERVLLVITFRAKGKRSGVPVEQQMGVVMTVRDGKIGRSETYPSVQEALEAVGPEE
jgi:ketosteroid isomerase-like protein